MLIIRDLSTPFLLHLLSSSLAYSDLFWKSVEKSFANFVIDRNGVWELQQKLQVFLTSTVDWNEISVWMLNLERLKSFSSYYQRFTNHQNSIVFHLILSFVFVFAFHTNTNTTTCYNWNGRKQLQDLQLWLPSAWRHRLPPSLNFQFLDLRISRYQKISKSVLYFLDLDTYWTSRFCRPFSNDKYQEVHHLNEIASF